MSNQVLYIGSAYHLAIKNEQLILEPKAEGLPSASRVPEDLLFIELDHPQITISLAALQVLMAHKVAVLVADKLHLPAGLMLPFVGHTLQGRVQQNQWKNLRKMAPLLWREVVTSKIAQQNKILTLYGQAEQKLSKFQVLPGDKENAEAQAARFYFSKLFGDDFYRDAEGESPNSFLNYGYAVLRSQMARALVTSGLQLAPGLFHKNQYNPFPLADDMMEPYRPWVDAIVKDLTLLQDA